MFILDLYNQLLKVKYTFNLETLIYVETLISQISKFQLLEVVYRSSETQLQETENLD